VKARAAVILMAVLLLLYIGLAGQRAWLLLTSGDGIAIAMGVALLVLPLLALWVLGREVWFGWRAEQLGRRLEQEDALPAEDLALRPSGKVTRDEADAVFPAYRAAVESAPEDWRGWYRLGLAYDAASDRRRAREAVRRAIRLEAASRH
jgi:cytochrome c-type biogenesis protein CcmH/NrfG